MWNCASSFRWPAVVVGCMILQNTESLAGPPISFTEEAVSRGINYFVVEGDWLSGFGCGVAFADLDNDGDPDVILTGRADGRIGIYENDGTGIFADRTLDTDIILPSTVSGVVAGDYDGDGLLDLYITNWSGPNLLLRNLGSLQFSDVASAAGVADDGAGQGAIFGDYDLDGWLDIYLPNRTYPLGSMDVPPNRLYHNLGNGTFEEVAAAHGVDDRGASFQAAFVDYDLDGDPDLYVTNDKGTKDFPNRLWKNVAGTFVEVTTESATGVIGDFMGLTIGDFDQNGFPDLYTTNVPTGNALLLNAGDGTFVESAGVAGVLAYASGWGTHFLDYDNDGDEDLYVVNNIAPDMLFEFTGVFPAIDIAAVVGLADAGSSAFCSAVADIDGDGDLDILLQNLLEGIRLFVNNANDEGNPARHWLKVKLVGLGGNRFAVGARVTIDIQGVLQSRQVLAGVSYKSSSSLLPHFGLGTANQVDSVTVTWPGGTTTIVENVAANQTLSIFQGGPPPIPAASAWGLIAMTIALLCFATRAFVRTDHRLANSEPMP